MQILDEKSKTLFKNRSVHICYDDADHDIKSNATRQSIISLVDTAASMSNISHKDFVILDAGCGIGILMRDLKKAGFSKIVGVDFDEKCISMAKRYANAKLVSLDNLDNEFDVRSVDMVILSHVLEHMPNPIDILKRVKRISRRWLILAVPNPIRPKILAKYAMRSKNYSNLGHLYSWDRSHFHIFLERHNRLRIIKWATDDVRVIPFAAFRRLLQKAKVLDLIELRLLPRWFPYFSSSLITLCEVR